MLGLRNYYYQEYKKAQDAVGDASLVRPDIWNDDLLHPWRAISYKIIEKANAMSLYMLYDDFHSLTVCTSHS